MGTERVNVCKMPSTESLFNKYQLSTIWKELLSCLVGSLETDLSIALSLLCDLRQGTKPLSFLL